MAEDQPQLPDPESEKQESSPPDSTVAADAAEPALSEPGMETESQPKQPLQQNMEVHHHTHHPKTWRQYFWEFFMLFLAVFCGFLAEYQLEHKIEQVREKKFMQLLVADLKADADSIARIKVHREERFRQADSLRTALLDGSYSTQGSGMYFWGRNISRRRQFFSADGTMQQLKNSGGLRLVHNATIIQQIVSYDVTYRAYLSQLQVEMDLINEYRQFAARVFDASVFQTISSTNLDYRPPGSPALFDASAAARNELANKVNYIMGSQYRLTQLLDDLSLKAKTLSAAIEKEYGLKN